MTKPECGIGRAYEGEYNYGVNIDGLSRVSSQVMLLMGQVFRAMQDGDVDEANRIDAEMVKFGIRVQFLCPGGFIRGRDAPRYRGA